MHNGIVRSPLFTTSRQLQSVFLCRKYATRRKDKLPVLRELTEVKKKASAHVTNPKQVSFGKRGGSHEIAAKVQYPIYERVAETGKYDENVKKYRHIKEMVPEFIVPDLKDFKLKAYVPWGTEEINQAEFTPRDLFFATYAKDLEKDFSENKTELEDSGKENI
ncbi:large ribosomal subunit protein mL41-like [Ylistrum balloti]|uniref:large ribosomal subunit protein mL41-like n=1 Tax=Ylistrum balloti TaxID=509963 RepID=UPI002905C934|nr:large ribosomal subunit protein mL41-like [Ylistrum balloti]